MVGIEFWALGMLLGYLGLNGALHYLGMRAVGLEMLRAMEV